MKFVTLAEMSRAIRENFHKVPHDVDFVVGLPRSGVIAAGIIAEFLNAPLIDIDSFIFGAHPTGGRRLRFHRSTGREKPRVLIVDDTIFHGRSMRDARQKLAPLTGRYDFVYLAVFLEGPCSDVDVWLEDVRMFTDHFSSFVLYEWNIFHHISRFMEVCLYDIDGVMCVDPPDERSGQPYVDYITAATPLFTPTPYVGGIVTYRLAKYENITRRWLSDHCVTYGSLTMFPAYSYDDRSATGITPSRWKADAYNVATWAKLFVESDDRQARDIQIMTGKPVYCVQSNKLYS
ncbi:MAG: hypothetical protein J6037_03785 [Bacteroidales bacterium]|nr:hypothetical protein [Bacteroidales bacterium]